VAYSDQAAFLAAALGTVSTLDFESLTPGTDLSGASVPVGPTSITFPLDVDDVAGDPGETLNLMVAVDAGDNPTASPSQSLGTNDIGNYDLLIAGSEILFTFTAPLSGLGLSIITPEAPGTFLLDDDVQLVVPGQATAVLELSAGQLVGNIDGDDYYAYFVGVISDEEITAATLSYAGATPDGSFLFNIDDIVVVPEPEATTLLMIGVAALFALDRMRSNRGEGPAINRNEATGSLI
jgi:hypothetical protein